MVPNAVPHKSRITKSLRQLLEVHRHHEYELPVTELPQNIMLRANIYYLSFSRLAGDKVWLD